MSSLDESEDQDSIFKLFSASYNVEGVDLSGLFASLGFNAKVKDRGGLTNFVPSLLALDRFIEAHAYLEDSFRAATGVGLEDFLYVLWALSNLALFSNRQLESKRIFGLFMFQLLRRGYAIYTLTFGQLLEEIKSRIEIFPELSKERTLSIERSAEVALHRVTLTSALQEKISLWSGGPRAVVVPFGGQFVIDVVGNLEFLARMFTGIEDDGGVRGRVSRRQFAKRLPLLFRRASSTVPARFTKMESS